MILQKPTEQAMQEIIKELFFASRAESLVEAEIEAPHEDIFAPDIPRKRVLATVHINASLSSLPRRKPHVFNNSPLKRDPTGDSTDQRPKTPTT